MATAPLLCSQCLAPLDDTNRPRRGGICLPCRRANGRAHDEANRAYYVEKARRRQIRVRADVRAWLLAYLLDHPCVDCGIEDPRVLKFDHREPAQKRAAVSWLATVGFNLAAVQAEVAKCDIRCANCHQIRTREQSSWWSRERDGAE